MNTATEPTPTDHAETNVGAVALVSRRRQLMAQLRDAGMLVFI